MIFKTMKLKKSHIAAGAVEVTGYNCNGSVVVYIDLEKIDRKSNGTNFRKYQKRHTNEILSNFKVKAVQNPILLWNCETSCFQTIDGRHTISALLENNFSHWTADVHFKMTRPEASSLFYELTQKSKRMTMWDSFAAALEGEYPHATVIDENLQRYGFTTPKDDGYNSNTADFGSFSPLMECWELGVDFLSSFLSILTVWKTEHGLEDRARMCAFQRGLIDFMVEYTEHYHPSQLAAILKKRSAAEITVRASDVGGERVERNHFKQAFESVMSIGSRRRLRMAA